MFPLHGRAWRGVEAALGRVVVAAGATALPSGEPVAVEGELHKLPTAPVVLYAFRPLARAARLLGAVVGAAAEAAAAARHAGAGLLPVGPDVIALGLLHGCS